jgi:amino acid transporter
MGYTSTALQGFDLTAAVGGEVREPAKTVPKAMVLSLGIALAIYLPLLFTIATVGTPEGQTIAAAAAANPEGIVAIAAQQNLGPGGYWLVIIAAVLSMFSATRFRQYRQARAGFCLCQHDREILRALRIPDKRHPIEHIPADH